MKQRQISLLKRLRKFFFTQKEKFLFKFSHLSMGGKITLLWIFLSALSLFLPWAEFWSSFSDPKFQNLGISSWSPIIGSPAIFISLVLLCIIFSLISIQKKEKFRFLTFIHLTDYIVGIIGSVFTFFLSLHTYIIIWGLRFFSSSIMYDTGIILCLTGSIFIGVGSWILKKEERQNIRWSYVHDFENQARFGKNTQDSKDNMKLPF